MTMLPACERFLNRELSRLAFDRRVLTPAAGPDLPPAEAGESGGT